MKLIFIILFVISTIIGVSIPTLDEVTSNSPVPTPEQPTSPCDNAKSTDEYWQCVNGN